MVYCHQGSSFVTAQPFPDGQGCCLAILHNWGFDPMAGEHDHSQN